MDKLMMLMNRKVTNYYQVGSPKPHTYCLIKHSDLRGQEARQGPGSFAKGISKGHSQGVGQGWRLP